MNTTTTKRPRRRAWLVALGSLAIVSGLLVPAVTAAAASPGKPGVTVSTISGSSSLKLSWKALVDDGVNVSKYRVYYGTSSSRSKAAKKDVTVPTPASPVYILGGLKPSTTYYIWVQPWESDKSALGPSGSISTVDKKKTAKYGYKPPIEVFVANTTTTTAEITFRTVTGAPIYRIKAAAAGHTTRYAYTGADGNWVIKDLDPNTTYTFTVSCALSTSGGYALLSKESTAKAKGKTKNFPVAMRYPTTQDPDLVNAPHVDRALWLADTENPTNSQFYNGANVSFRVPDGFDHTQHGIRFVYAKDQRMTSAKGSFDYLPTIAPVDPRSPLAGITTRPAGGLDEEDGGTPPTDELETTPPTEAPPESTPPTGDPDPVTTLPTDPDQTESPSDPAPDESPATAAAASAGEKKRVTATLLAATDKGYTSVRVNLPAANTNYYVRVQVISRANKSVISDTSQALLIKTRSRFGFIKGKVEPVAGQPWSKTVCENYVVLAYGKTAPGFKGGTGLDVHQRVSLAKVNASGVRTCDGTFEMEVRPNTGYVLQAHYVGPRSSTNKDALIWQSGWYRASSDPAAAVRSAGATGVTVAVGNTTALANPIRVAQGGNLTGTAKCPKGSNSGTSGTCTVDVAAIHGSGNYNNVVTTVRSNSSGVYILKGLPAGTYTIRVSKAEDGIFKKIADAVKAKVKYVHESGVVVEAGKVKTVNID